METIKTMYVKKDLQVKRKAVQTGWQRTMLLSILFYESAGCLVGGTLLILAPDGSLMKMPVDIMHHVFRDFLIPGNILFGLGILNAITFVFHLSQKKIISIKIIF